MLCAHDVTASLTGTLTDALGALIPGAIVVARSTETNAIFKSKSGNDGVYWLRELPVGYYTLEVSAPGFETFRQENVGVAVNDIGRVDVQLVIGSPRTTISVGAEPVAVDSTSGTLKTAVLSEQIEDLPLDGRNPVQLVTLIAGVTSDPAANVTSGTTYGRGLIAFGISVDGNRSNANNYILDGVSYNDSYTNVPNPFPSPDALEEFTVDTNNFGAEFGRSPGSIINAVTKSGTNNLHGTAFEYVRNSDFNAANYFNPTGPNGGKLGDGLKRNQFGGTLGGPVWLPKIYRGKDKTFFFFSYQATLIRQAPFSSQIFVPTAAERSGDFSGLSTPIINFNTGVPYPDGRIPQSQLNSISRAILNNYIPLPTSGNFIYASSPNDFNDRQYLIRIDHQFSNANRLSGRYFDSRSSEPAYLSPRDILENTVGGNWFERNIALTDTQSISAGLVNQTIFGYNQTNGYFAPLQPGKSLVDLGVQMYEPKDYKYEIYVDGYFTIDTGDTNSFPRHEYDAQDSLRWSRAKNEIAIGAEYVYGTADIFNNYQANGIFDFNGGAPFTGNALADFMVGKFNTLTQGTGQYKNNRYRQLGVYFQESWKAARNLSVELGMRWEPFFPYTDTQNRLAVYEPGARSTRYPNAPEGVLFAGDPGVPAGAVPADLRNFAPRTGFAWDILGNGKTSLRGGYGIFYDYPNSISTNNQSTQAPFGTVVTTFGDTLNSFSNPYAGALDPFPQSTNPPSSVAFLPYSQQTLYDAKFRNAYVQAWNATIEHELAGNFVWSASYVGSKGTDLFVVSELNPAVYVPGATTATTNQRRIFAPALGDTSLMQSTGNSIFHSFQTNLNRRFAKGLTILANYQFAKSIDDSSATKGTGITRTNPFNQGFDRGPSDFDRAHVAHISALYSLPFHFHTGLTEALAGGWNVSAIATLTSGYPFTVTSGVDNARTGQPNQRADLTGISPYFSGPRTFSDEIQSYLNPAAFNTNAIGTYGDLGRNTFFGPPLRNIDFACFKDFKAAERLTATLRFEMFNALNTVNLGQPNSVVTGPAFMQITNAGNPRILQGAIRFRW